MSAFVDKFNMTKTSSESRKSARKPGIRLGLTIAVFNNDKSMFITECHVHETNTYTYPIICANQSKVRFWTNK